jgi:hypothetical protein
LQKDQLTTLSMIKVLLRQIYFKIFKKLWKDIGGRIKKVSKY